MDHTAGSKPGRAPTLSDVALIASVSHQTVSRVINNRAAVDANTRSRVLQAIEAIGYQPNYVARSLTTKVTNTVAVLIPTVGNPYFADIVAGIESVAVARGVGLLLVHSAFDPEREMQHAYQMRRRRVDGLILCHSRLESSQLQALSETTSVPMVLVHRTATGHLVGSVGTDRVDGVRRSVAYLHGLGHNRIGLMSTSLSHEAKDDFLRGYKLGLQQVGLDFEPPLVVVAPSTIGGGEATAGTLLDAGGLPTAIICQSDVMAMGTLRACSARGLEVPRDMSVLGWGDIEFATVTSPPLTTMHVPRFELGVAAAELWLEMIDKEPANREVILPLTLVQRDSCCQYQGRKHGPCQRPSAET